MKSLRYNLNNAIDIIRQNGWVDFFKSTVHEFFGFPAEEFYVYEHTLKERNPADFMTTLENYEEFILRNRSELDELVSKGYDFGSRLSNNRIALVNGAIVHCMFINKELVHIGRIALNPKAKRYVTDMPMKVDFDNREALTGETWSNPKFRGEGLMKYGYYQRFEFLRELGVKITRNSVWVTNVASNKVHDKFKPKITAIARYRLFLFLFKYWKEIPYQPS
jgi:hypothetical protein